MAGVERVENSVPFNLHIPTKLVFLHVSHVIMQVFARFRNIRESLAEPCFVVWRDRR